MDTFIISHPWLTFYLALVTGWLSFVFSSRALRVLTILVRGWPPAHLDAEGNLRDDYDGDL